MVGHFLEQEPVLGYAVFRARLGLTVVTLASNADSKVADRVLAHVAAEATEAGDGYAARDVLGYLSTLTGSTNVQREALSRLVSRSGQRSGTARASARFACQLGAGRETGVDRVDAPVGSSAIRT
jgi:hypothetical protein